MKDANILVGDCLESLRGLPEKSVQCCVTSPPYWGLRDYGHEGQLGLEKTPEEYTAKMVEVFREVRRVLRDDGVLWLNVGDSYANNTPSGPQGKTLARRNRTYTAAGLGSGSLDHGLKPKDLVGIPWRVAFALQADGWWLRSDVIWAKPNPMPESVTDRPTKAHEYVFLLSKSARYFYDADAVKEATNGRERFGNSRELTHDDRNDCDRRDMTPNWHRNKRSVWTVTTQPYPGAHFAVMPPKLVEPCILAGSAVGDTVLDPFAGTATVGVVALQHGREFIGCELNPEYAEMARARLKKDAGQGLMFTPMGEAL